MTYDEPRGVLFTGRLGAGKSTLAIDTFAVLAEHPPAAALDLDWLAWARPRPPGRTTIEDLLEENLRSVRPVYAGAGIRFYVLARAVSHAHEVEAIRRALVVPLQVARVTADAALAEARIRSRDTGAELESNLADRHSFGDAIHEDFTIDNGDRPIRDVALELLDRLGWTRMVR